MKRLARLFGLFVFASAATVNAERPLVRIGHPEPAYDEGGRDYSILEARLLASTVADYRLVARAGQDALYEALVTAEIEGALLGPIQYVRARREAGVIPLVSDGPSYHSVLVVREDSSINEVSDLPGRSLALGYPESTSSHLYPLLMISRARVKEEELASIDFVGGHHQAAEAVQAGTSDVGGLILAVFEQYREKAPGLRRISTSPPIPSVPVVLLPAVDGAIHADLRQRLLDFRPPAGKRRIPLSRGAVEVTDRDYNEIRFLCRVVLGKDYR